MRHALAILTFASPDCPAGQRLRLPHALQSLADSTYDGQVIIVDDGSSDPAHLDYLDSLHEQYRVVRRTSNGGISRAKNTCIRLLMESGAQVAFIAEDDIEFHAGWHIRYLQAHATTGIAHFSWAWDLDPDSPMSRTPVVLNGCTIDKTSHLNGLLLTFTPAVIQRIGGFKILPQPWGQEHTNWTRRIVQAGLAPFFADVPQSNDLVRMGPYGVHSALTREQKQCCAKENRRSARDLSVTYCPLTE
jgi:glycosyltransferase involved in cell wall biosynthesis